MPTFVPPQKWVAFRRNKKQKGALATKPSKKAISLGIIILIALIILPLLWYLRPRTLDTALRLDKRDVTNISASCILTEDIFTEEAGFYTYHRAFNIPDENIDIDAIMELLRSTRYRYDLRSLTFPEIFTMEDTGGTASLTINFDDQSHVFISCLGDRTTFSFRSYPGLVIAATDGDFFERLAGYICEVGVEN